MLLAADASTPKIDKARFETYLRYAEGFTAPVKFDIDDPAPSAYKGYSRVVVHLSVGAQKVGDRLYYVREDGEEFISGAIWNLNQNPFLDTLEHLPSGGFSFGPANAKVAIVAFSDFECPYCREFAKTVRENLPAKYPDTVRFEFQDFPIDTIHPWARAAAEIGRCLGDQKPAAFWVFHDWIFEHQQQATEWFKSAGGGKPGSAAQAGSPAPEGATSGAVKQIPKEMREQAMAIAKGAGLDASSVGTCIDTRATAKAVEESVRVARALQIQQTPTLFINGRMAAGAIAWKDLDAVIQLELNRPKQIPGPDTAKCCEVTIPTVLKK